MDIDLAEFRKKYPQYDKWSDERLSRAIQLKHNKEGVPESEKGWAGIESDIENSLETLPDAAANLISSIPGGIKNIKQYATTHNPLKTLGHLGAGGIEGIAGLASAPEEALNYFGNKFPALGEWVKKNRQENNVSPESKTMYQMLMDFEKKHGLNATSKEEKSVRNLGDLLLGGKVLSKLKSPVAGTSVMAAEQAGRGGDPLHAAILGALGHTVAKAPWKETIKNAPKNIAEGIKNAPEILGTGAASILGSAADIGTKLHIPGIPSTLELLSSYLKHKSVSPEKFAQRQLLGDIKSEDFPVIEERANAANRLGLDYLTPAELTLSPFEAAKQGDIGRTPAGSTLLFKKGKGRETSEATAINKLLDTIYDAKELDPKKEAAYKETMEATVPDDFIERQTKRPVIEQAIKKVENDPAYKQKLEEELGIKLGDVKPNSFMYWDMIKRILGDMGENAKEQGRPTTKSDIYADTRRSMVADMDKIKPEYEVARGIAERKFTRRELENVFDKKTMTFNNFHSFLKSKNKFDKVMNKLKAYPEAQQMLKDIHLLSGDMIPNNPSIRTSTQMTKTGMWNPRNKFEALQRELDKKYGQEHDVASVNLMTNPRLFEILKEHLNK